MTWVGHFFPPCNRKITHHNTGTQLFGYPAMTSSRPLHLHLPSKNVLSRSWNALESPSRSPSERVREPPQLPTNVLFLWLFSGAGLTVQRCRHLRGCWENKPTGNPTTKYLWAGRGWHRQNCPCCSSSSHRTNCRNDHFQSLPGIFVKHSKRNGSLMAS